MTMTINNEHKKLNVPNLRFPEFQGEWEKKRLEECVEFLDGLRKPIKSEDRKSEQGLYPYYGASGIIDYIDGYIFDGEYILLSEDGANIIDRNYRVAFIAKGKIWVNNHAHVLQPYDGFDINFLSETLERLNYAVYNTGTTMPKLNQEVCRNINLKIPTTKEQNKIGNLLSLLNKRIATQNKIIEDLKKLKSAISKKLLCNDKWTTYKIQDIAEIGRGRVISSVEIDRQKHPLYPVYSSQTSNNGIMGYLDNYMFDGEYITWTTDGANAGTVFYRKGKFNCTNVCGTLKILPKFDCYFVSLVLQQATQKYVSSNLANPKLMNNTMASIKIRMPNIETQKQLSKVFQTLDSCLLVHQRTCKMYLSEKQYLLRQMFI